MAMPYELDADEIGYFYAAVATDPHSGGEEVVARDVLNGKAQLWIYHDRDTILCTITRAAFSPDGYGEMLVHMMAGTNVTSTLAHHECERAIMEYALRIGCSKMIAYVKPEIWKHFDKTTGYVVDYVAISLSPDAVIARSEPVSEE